MALNTVPPEHDPTAATHILATGSQDLPVGHTQAEIVEFQNCPLLGGQTGFAVCTHFERDEFQTSPDGHCKVATAATQIVPFQLSPAGHAVAIFIGVQVPVLLILNSAGQPEARSVPAVESAVHDEVADDHLSPAAQLFVMGWQPFIG